MPNDLRKLSKMKNPANKHRGGHVLVKIRGIYQIRNVLNNRTYIGSSSDVTTRWTEHITAILQHQDKVLQKLTNSRIIEDYIDTGRNIGLFEFGILEMCPTLDNDELLIREYELIAELNPYYNIKRTL